MPVRRPNPELDTSWIWNPEKQHSNSKKEIANPQNIHFRIRLVLKANSEIRKSPKIERVFRLNYWAARLKLQAVPDFRECRCAGLIRHLIPPGFAIQKNNFLFTKRRFQIPKLSTFGLAQHARPALKS